MRDLHQKFMDEMNLLVSKVTSSTYRIGWASWITIDCKERWYPWQVTTLLLLTNAVHDKVVRNMVQELFSRYPDPIKVCQNPDQFLDYITSRAKDFQPLSLSFDPGNDGISKGPNFCYQKSKFMLAMTKHVCLKALLSIVPNAEKINVLEQLETGCCPRMMYALRRPVPGRWLSLLESNYQETCFPKTFDKSFFDNLPGIGLKMTNLAAEQIYKQIMGPAIDCHCIRWSVSMGTVSAAHSVEQMSRALLHIFRLDQMPSLNEVPATISQFIHSHQNDNDCTFIESMLETAKKYGLRNNLIGFLSQYSVSKRILDAESSESFGTKHASI